MRRSTTMLFGVLLAGCAGTQVESIAAAPDHCFSGTEDNPMIGFSREIDRTRVLTVAAVGDVLLHDRLQKYAAGHRDGFYAMMEPVAHIIRAADVSFANLEGPAAAGVTASGHTVEEPEGRYDGKIYAGYPSFNYHPSIAADLRRTGFDIVLTANNHALDRLSAGADGTVRALTEAGLSFTGSRASTDEHRAWYTVTPVAARAGTFNIAWLGCTYGVNEQPDPHRQILNCFEDRDTILEEIAALRTRADVHAVIFAPHWGTEYRHKPNKKQRALAYDALEAGALAVLGTHSHVVSPWEKYITKDGRETFITYSLGNFVSNQEGLARRASLILLLGLMPDATGRELSVAAAGWIPIHMYRADGKGISGPIHVEPIDGAGGRRAAMELLLKHLPAENMHPATADFWGAQTCTAPTS